MSLRAFSPAAVRRVALAGAAIVALGGFLPHELCVHRLECGVPWASLAPLAVAALVVRRGWTDRRAILFGAVAGAFWGAGLFLVSANLARVTTDALYGSDFLGALHRLAAALYLYGATVALAAFLVRESRRPAPESARAALVGAAALAVLPVLGVLAPVAADPAGSLAEGVPELLVVATASATGSALAALLARG